MRRESTHVKGKEGNRVGGEGQGATEKKSGEAVGPLRFPFFLYRECSEFCLSRYMVLLATSSSTRMIAGLAAVPETTKV